MGLITSHCCAKNDNNSNTNQSKDNEKIKLKIQYGVSDLSNNLSSSFIDNNNNKKVSFNGTLEQRNVYIENEKKYTDAKYDDIKKNPFVNQGNEDEEENLFTNVSFEESENKFIIEDNFHKQRSLLPKTFEEIENLLKKTEKSVENFFIENKNKIIKVITEIKNQSCRIDCIIPGQKENVHYIIILTEFHIFYFESLFGENFKQKQYLLNDIDFLTVTRNGRELIIHLIENRILIIKSNIIKLEKVAACLCSSYLLCKKGDQITNTRQLSVIVIDENFEILEKIEKTSNYIIYRDALNNFLEEKLKKVEINEIKNFKYIAVKLSIEGNNISANVIITKSFFFVLLYKNRQFEIIHKIKLSSMTKLIPNLRTNRLKIYNNDSFKTTPLIVQSESFCSILSLIEEIIK